MQRTPFQNLMAEATRLTRTGRWRGATQLLREALQGAAAPAAAGRPGNPMPPSPAAPAAAQAPDVAGEVIDVQAREVFPAARETPSAAPETDPATQEIPPVAQRASPGASPAAERQRYGDPDHGGAGSAAAHGLPSGAAGGEAPPVSPAPSAPQERADAGEGSFVAGSFSSPAGTRAWKLYIPPAASGSGPRPLVVMLHGCTQDPDDFAAGTGMNAAARRQGFYVLYPAQTQHANSARCWNWFKHSHQARGRGEPAILAGMVREAMDRHAIDPQRVYVAGLSAGGAMAAIVGAGYPELFAAVGVHSGLAPGAATNMQAAFKAMQAGGSPAAAARPGPPTIVFHGDADATVHPVNGEQVVQASGAAAAPGRSSRARSAGGREYTRHVYPADGGGVSAEHWVVHGGGHAWSGGSAAGSYTDAQGPDATDAMLQFFFAHPLRAAAP